LQGAHDQLRVSARVLDHQYAENAVGLHSIVGLQSDTSEVWTLNAGLRFARHAFNCFLRNGRLDRNFMVGSSTAHLVGAKPQHLARNDSVPYNAIAPIALDASPRVNDCRELLQHTCAMSASERHLDAKALPTPSRVRLRR
jgi:hypothetical protein